MNNTSETLRDTNGSKLQGEPSRVMTNPHSNRTRILVADDQPDVREALRLLLKGEGFDTETRRVSCRRARGARSARVRRGADGPELRARHHVRPGRARSCSRSIRAKDSTLPVVVMTAWGSLELAVEAMRRGAKDFVQKPWENARLLAILRTQIELFASPAQEPAPRSRKSLAARRRPPDLDRRIGRDAAGDGFDRARRALGRQRADHRRARHRQGSRRAHSARALAARRTAARHRQRRRAARRRFRERALRPREGRVHRRKRRTASAGSNWRTAARSSSTKSPTSR